MPKTFVEGEETLAQQAHRQLRQRIVEGRLRPGQRLPLRPLALELGMSMAPVGEALRELTREGLLETEPGWGARVRRLDSEALRNQHVLRMALECEAIRRCAVCATDEQVGELNALATELDRLIDTRGDWKKISERDTRFHLRIAQYSGASVLVDTLKANQLVRMLARGGAIARNLQRPRKQHVQLVDAIRGRDPEVAERAMREHCQRSLELQLAHLSAVDGQNDGIV